VLWQGVSGEDEWERKCKTPCDLSLL
jgi:hypothetical protein